MKCCKLRKDDESDPLPFDRIIAIGYYDGPTDGFTECSQCHQTYSFRKLDWDDAQDVRVFGFSPVQVSLETIIAKLGVDFSKWPRVAIVPPLAGFEDRFVKELFNQPPTHVAAFKGWPGESPLWRNIMGLDTSRIHDWFSFLGIPKAGGYRQGEGHW
jgi:hypothetical protein